MASIKFAALFATLTCFQPVFGQTANLASYNVDPTAITVSGISSGAFMAIQMEVAFSKTFSGAASVAGGIYWCAEGQLTRAETTCMSSPTTIDPTDQINEAQSLASSGAIDPLSNLATHQVYIYASPKDTIINPVNSQKLTQFLTTFMDASHIQTENSIQSEHGWPTLNSGNACDMAALPWILNCNYDAAGAVLKTMYGASLNPPVSAVAANLIQFSQAEFQDSQTSLYPTGWVYVPTSCAQGARCRLHVALHGCEMNPDFIQNQFVTLSGFNEWAESNNIIVLYPQSAKLGTANPNACWDWYGFTGSNYVTQSGVQMADLKNMIDRVTGN